MSERGIYTVIEGGDGVGKSTVMNGLAKRNREERGVKTFTLEEPDSIRDEAGNALVPIAEEIRRIIKAKEFGRSALTNVLLFNAARRENLLQGIEPLLDDGFDIFAARNKISTTVYQGHGQGWDLAEIDRMVLEATSESYMNPDHVFILDLPEDERLLRLAKRDSNANLDTFESLPTEFQISVGNGYRTVAADEGYPLISARPAPEVIVEEIWQHIHNSSRS